MDTPQAGIDNNPAETAIRPVALGRKNWLFIGDREAGRSAANLLTIIMCEAYFPETFSLPGAPDHLEVIVKIETAVLRGGLFAMAMPRGSGTTTLAETACIWAMLTTETPEPLCCWRRLRPAPE